MSKYDITDDMNQWEYAMYNMRQQRKDRVDALIKKYGFPIDEENLLKEDYYEYDVLKQDLEAMKTAQLASQPMPHGSSLDDEDMARNAAIVKAKKEVATQTNTDAELLREIQENSQKTSSIDYSKYGKGFSKDYINKMLNDQQFQKTMSKYTRENEGGIANHKKDTGGLTNMGITKKYYPNENIKELTRERADALLYRDYWINTKIYQLPDELSGIVFDNAVVQGQPTAIMNLQKALGVKADGLIGEKTLKALKGVDYDEVKKAFIKNVHKREDIIIKNNPSQKVFENGHRNRYNRYY